MRSYVYESVKLSDGKRLVTRYTLGEVIWFNILKFLFYLFMLWPLEIFVWRPLKLMVKGSLIGIEMMFRLILWIIKCPFYLACRRRLPRL